jgi:hypothetical protein
MHLCKVTLFHLYHGSNDAIRGWYASTTTCMRSGVLLILVDEQLVSTHTMGLPADHDTVSMIYEQAVPVAATGTKYILYHTWSDVIVTCQLCGPCPFHNNASEYHSPVQTDTRSNH